MHLLLNVAVNEFMWMRPLSDSWKEGGLCGVCFDICVPNLRKQQQSLFDCSQKCDGFGLRLDMQSMLMINVALHSVKCEFVPHMCFCRDART